MGIETVFSGDIRMLHDYQTATKDHVYIETRLDADDAMYQDFMRRTQGQVARTLGLKAKRANFDPSILSMTPEFQVFCAEYHLEWGYFNPWQKDSTKGYLFGVDSSDYCVTPGLTYAFQVGTKPNGVVMEHHRLAGTHPKCKDKKDTNCISHIDAGEYKYVMLRSRTPSSTGMAGVIPTPEIINSTYWRAIQDKAWSTYVFKNFGITPKSIWDLQAYFTNDMENILKDALNGQCTRAEFTCKNSSNNDLMHLLEELKKYSTQKLHNAHSLATVVCLILKRTF
ncbi:hypothetical protein ACA910_011001 [Epithemia clementina (nom. ined.)]